MESASAFPNLLFSSLSYGSARAKFFRPSAARQAHAFSPRRHASSPADRDALVTFMGKVDDVASQTLRWDDAGTTKNDESNIR